MIHRPAVSWTKFAHYALVGVLFAGPLWITATFVGLLFPSQDPLCERLGCDSPPVPFIVVLATAFLVTVFVIWIGVLIAQIRLASGPPSPARLTTLAIIDLSWAGAALWGLAASSQSGPSMDPARIFAWIVVALAIAGCLTCLLAARAPRSTDRRP